MRTKTVSTKLKKPTRIVSAGFAAARLQISTRELEALMESTGVAFCEIRNDVGQLSGGDFEKLRDELQRSRGGA